MIRSWTTLHVIALFVGGYIVATEVASNVEHIVHGTGSIYNPAVFIAIGVSVGTVFSFTMAMDAMENWKKISSWINAAGLIAAFIFGTAFTLSTTLDRTAIARDNALTKVWKNDQEMKNLDQLYQTAQYSVSKECGSGRGKKCEALSVEIVNIKKQIEVRQSDLDSMGKRINVATGGLISAENASILQPMLLPIAMFLMGTFMLAYGMKGRETEPTASEFDLELTGMDAKEEKAKRFIREYKKKNRKLPSVSDVRKVSDVSYPTAVKYLKKHKNIRA